MALVGGGVEREVDRLAGEGGVEHRVAELDGLESLFGRGDERYAVEDGVDVVLHDGVVLSAGLFIFFSRLTDTKCRNSSKLRAAKAVVRFKYVNVINSKICPTISIQTSLTCPRQDVF